MRSSWLSSAEEGDSPQCGEMSRRDKRAGHLLKWRASCSPKSNVSHETLLLEKPIFSVRQKGVPPLLLPASVQQLPRCLVRICNLFHKGNQIANWNVSKKCNCSRENLLQNNLLRKCGLLAHTSAAFLKNCCTEKRFSCLRLGSYSKYATKFVSQSTILSTSFEKMVEIHIHIYIFPL